MNQTDDNKTAASDKEWCRLPRLLTPEEIEDLQRHKRESADRMLEMLPDKKEGRKQGRTK